MLGAVADRALEPVFVAERRRLARIYPIVDHRRLIIDRNPGVPRIAPVADLVRGGADLVKRQDVMVRARVHFGMSQSADAGVLIPVAGDVDDEARGAGAHIRVRGLYATVP